ncbi:unnamed protein product, partial [Brenthis ino]
MDKTESKEWKKKLGFPVNYDSGQSSDDDSDINDVEMRHSRHSSKYLLAEDGDGSEADMLGTTPPRARNRDKEKRRNMYMSSLNTQRISLSEGKKMDVTDFPSPPERLKRRANLKLTRSKERDWKDDQRESRADSLPSPHPQPAVPTLVESCSRFMSLTSRLKCRESQQDEVQERCTDEEIPASRVNFHNTFSMLINMGNIEKGCRRTISREEQVWQNELKDLIWLEIKAKLGGRSLGQQDALLCARRGVVPLVVRRIEEYKFVNPYPCRNKSQNLTTMEGSQEDLTSDQSEEPADEDSELSEGGCVSVDCARCSAAVGAAMRQLRALLDAHADAVALYPSSSAAAADHPALRAPHIVNRLKAMCLWYNTALHMRLKVMSVRRMLRTARGKRGAPAPPAAPAAPAAPDSNSTCANQRESQVRFNISNNTSDSNNSESSAQSERSDTKESGSEEQNHVLGQGDQDRVAEDKQGDVTDSGHDKGEWSGQTTPETYSTADTADTTDTADTADTSASAESGYGSDERGDDVFQLGALRDVAQLRLLGRADVSAYRYYHYEMLKTQGVRRCMMFMEKLCHKLLNKVYLTLLEPPNDEFGEEEYLPEVFEDTKDNKTDLLNEDAKRQEAYEYRRYGCLSAECRSMALPSYRAHFLLLASICMEAVHDYLALRMEGTPENPSCLTIKQLIHELKEGIEIAAEMRASFSRHAAAALRGAPRAPQLRALLDTYDATVATALQKYLSYLKIMSEKESLSRAQLSGEWAFTQRLWARALPAAALAPPAFADMACNQLNRILKRFEEKFEQVMELEAGDHSEYDDERHTVYALCRETQCIYASEREAALQAAHWARHLVARLAPAHRPHAARIFNSLMAMRDTLVKQTSVILERSRPLALPSQDLPKDIRDSLGARVRELLLQVYKLGFELHMELHKSAQTRPRAARARPASLQAPRAAAPRAARRPDTIVVHAHNPIHKELHRFVNDSPQSKSPRSLMAGSPRRMKFLRSESIGEDVLDYTYSVTAAPTKPDAPAAEAEGAEWAARVARAVIEFAKCWMHFVVERCDRGRGLRPRWASQGLEFLMLACDPCNTKHLSDEEFEELKQLMDGCISHVIGSRGAPPAPAPPHRQRAKIHSPLSSTSSVNSRDGNPPTPPAEPAAPTAPTAPTAHKFEDTARNKRVLEAVRQLDEARDEKLQNSKMVGKVLESATRFYEPKLRQVTFKWQRGLKIGAGTFGKVYTIVNTESGQLLAMKELGVGAGDRRALQRAANELRVLEGVLHPHLVRYYGCEMHREEMLLFMELCVEGSLEALLATAGALQEPAVRRYTLQLLSAVAELHARAIAHRDIKSGNIFLTNEGHCLKLGDFGCAVKIRANTTAPGELQGYVGTQAYMAPEVFMKSSGHGRAADIWSLGCVVTEMASGKRPFSEYDSNYQIMFVVGMGGRPAVPAALSDEGRQFCLSCLTHDPDARPRAEALRLHHFLMVKSDDDCKCETAYLMSSNQQNMA